VGYEGRPSDTQVQRADALAREVADVKLAFETWVTNELSSINALLAARKIRPIGRTTPTGLSRPRS
jgi:hypothetical protein